MRILLNCLILKSRAFSFSASVQLLSVNIYSSLFFFSSGHVYLQPPGIKISRHPTSLVPWTLLPRLLSRATRTWLFSISLASGFLVCVFFLLWFAKVRDTAARKTNRGRSRKRWGRGRGKNALRKTASIQPLKIFETASEKWTQQTAFLTGRHNVNPSANVRFLVYTNFKGVPSVVMRLTWFVFASKNIHCQYLTRQVEVL